MMFRVRFNAQDLKSPTEQQPFTIIMKKHFKKLEPILLERGHSPEGTFSMRDIHEAAGPEAGIEVLCGLLYEMLRTC